MRVGGRLRYTNLPYNTKHPILLTKNYHFMQLVVRHYHLKYLHAAPQLLLATIRNTFWIVRGRRQGRGSEMRSLPPLQMHNKLWVSCQSLVHHRHVPPHNRVSNMLVRFTCAFVEAETLSQ